MKVKWFFAFAGTGNGSIEFPRFLVGSPVVGCLQSEEQIWNERKADAICGDNLRRDGLIGARKCAASV
jgi:hypothetical protein